MISNNSKNHGHTITINELDKVGSRVDFEIGTGYYKFYMGVSDSLLVLWGADPKIDIKKDIRTLATSLIEVARTQGTKIINYKFRFDSYNSGNTLAETIAKIEDLGIEPFIKDRTASDTYKSLLGDELFAKIDNLNNAFAEKHKQSFMKSLDCAFDFNQAKTDLNNPPKDLANFLLRVCILSGMIDHINVRLPKEKDPGSLNALQNWLSAKIGKTDAQRILKPFRMVKGLRKQYPIHDHYEFTKIGPKKERNEISQAKKYFNITNDQGTNWEGVLDKFIRVFDKLFRVI